MLEFDFKKRVGSFDLHVVGRQDDPRMGLFGPSGCGKTTLMNCLAGLLTPDEGVIKLNGETVFDSVKKINIPPQKRRIGYVFQDGRLFSHMSVRDNIEFGRQFDSSGPGFEELSEVFDIKDLLDRSPDTLSGGEYQRVGIARALAASPKLLLLDEPLSSVDIASKLNIMPYLAKAYILWQIPYIYVSHSLSEIIYLADMSWQMYHGKIIHSVHPNELLAKSSHEVDPILNIIEGTVESAPVNTGYMMVSCGDQKWKVPNKEMLAGEKVSMALQAGDMMVSINAPQGISARNVFRTEISHLEQNGHALWVVAAFGSNQLVVELTEESGRELGLKTGKQVYLVFKSHSVTVTSIK